MLLILGGMPMTFEGAARAHTLEGTVQTIARGPVAAVVAIKQLGTTGGGYFGRNSTHPFENPGFFTGVLSGRITGRRRHAAVVFTVISVFLALFVSPAIAFESRPAPALAGLPVTAAPNLEGKELRFGVAAGGAAACNAPQELSPPLGSRKYDDLASEMGESRQRGHVDRALA